MTDISPFVISISDEQITDLKNRIANTRWPDAETTSGWNQGVPLAYVKELVQYWGEQYDQQRLANRLNAFDNFKTNLLGLNIHFMHIKSSNPNARPLLLTHGWPGSVVEFLKVIGPLTEPQEHGGTADDAFHLVIPSLPGYGFSDKPQATGWGVEKIADAWSTLMARLGYSQYFAQGGDWGSVITSYIARQDPEHCLGIHINMGIVAPDPNAENLTANELSIMAGWKYYQDWDSGYSKQQATRPQTLGYGLVDSPSGQAAWIVEKFYQWMDCGGHPENIVSRDELLDNIMVYWLTGSGASSARLYWESFGGGEGREQPVSIPMGATISAKDIFRTSERFASRVFTNIVYWKDKEEGGHFAAFEQPNAFVSELRECFGVMPQPDPG
ncbi:MAG: epoxide hydrolase [Pseudomonadota bacterium]|jgi:pimeloyl-ACP methyl ester carboxylesterase|nr:epoxide hydrolase [Pseudomonadota bacterium]